MLNSGLNSFDKTNNTIQLYPNPNNGSFSIKNESGLDNLSLEIYNALGQLVFMTEPDKTEIESRLAIGMYYYAIIHHHEVLKTGKLLFE